MHSLFIILLTLKIIVLIEFVIKTPLNRLLNMIIVILNLYFLHIVLNHFY